MRGRRRRLGTVVVGVDATVVAALGLRGSAGLLRRLGRVEVDPDATVLAMSVLRERS